MGIPNGGDAPITTFFGAADPAAYYSTGAGGSPGGEDQPVFGERLATIATASDPYESSQGPRVMTTVDVGMANLPRQVPARKPLSGVDLGGSGEQTSAGQDNPAAHGSGYVSTSRHPNAAGMPHGSAGQAPGPGGRTVADLEG
jgi:hypothetical protein